MSHNLRTIPETMQPTGGVALRVCRQAWRLARKKPLGAFGALIVLSLAGVALLADFIAPYPYDETSIFDKLKPYSFQHFLGTDYLGRDLFSRVVYGARISVFVSLGAVALATIIAAVFGISSGYFGGKVDAVTQRFVDAAMSFPGLLLLLFIMAVVGPGIMNVILALGVLLGISESRVVRGATLAVKGYSYVDAARAVGAGHGRILLWYILPNVAAPIIVIATLQVGGAIIAEASLSFLGFGVPPPFPSWGGMLSGAGFNYMYSAPWLAIWPGVAIGLVVFGVNVFGDALRDVLDPRLRGGK